jgi:hypothetical protein
MLRDEFDISFLEIAEVNNLSSANKKSRVRFVRRVLTILMAQIGLALLMIHLCSTLETFRWIQTEWIFIDVAALIIMTGSAWAIKQTYLGRKVS